MSRSRTSHGIYVQKESLMTKILNKFKSTKVTRTDTQSKDINELLLQHPVYNQIEIWVLLKSGNLNILSQKKKLCTIAYMKILFDELNILLHDLANNSDKYIDSNVLTSNIISMLNKVRETALSDSIPEIFIDKINIFNYKYFQMVIDTAIEIYNSDFHPGTIEKLASVLDIMLFYIRVLTDNIEATVNGLNGELESALTGSVFDKES